MIGKLKGVIDELGEDYLLLDVGGVGYRVFVSQRALSTVGVIGEKCTLFIETQMREDAIRLFGFLHEQERAWFRLLQQVQGVGARVALALLGTLSVTEIADAIALRDADMLTRTPGVGKKVAERILTELKGKALTLIKGGGVASVALATIGAQVGVQGGFQGQESSIVSDAMSALGNLGYRSDQAAAAIAEALKQAGEEANSAKLIRLALQYLSKA